MPLFRNATPDADFSRTKYPWMVAAYCSFGLAICVILGIAGWGASVDFEEARVSNLRSEINRLRSHGVRTVIRLQELMNVENAANSKLSDVQFNEKLTDFLYDQWNRHIPDDPSRLYAGIVDSSGRIVAHYKRDLVGKNIGDHWASARVPEAGDDVVQTSDPLMTGAASNEKALDISIPIMHGTQEVGAYHSGFRLAWFENELALKRRDTTLRWGAAFAVITIVGLTAGVSLFKVARRLASLQGVVAMEHVRRLADLGTLAGGIAHEVRNPMNAIRLNLHVIKKLITSQGNRDAQTTQVMDETISEMERIDGLLRTMLEYARPAVGTLQIVDCAAEIRSVATFLSPLLERERIALKMAFSTEPCMVRADRGQFRQVVLNLIKNSMEAMKSDASIEVDCRRRGDLVEVVVGDEGPGISPEEREQIFEPFFSTKEIGTGLGLTLCRRYVEGAGGTIHYEVREPRGAQFVIRLPAVSPASEHEPAEPADPSKLAKLKSVTV